MEFLDAQKIKNLAEKEKYFVQGMDDRLSRAWSDFVSTIYDAADEYMKIADRYATEGEERE